MSYRKVKPISWNENSPKSKILRQQFALKFLDIDFGKKTVINVDETWLGMSDFWRMKWSQNRHSNSVKKLPMNPRISMIAGLDTQGEIFLSLLQANSNSKNMVLFFSELIRILDEQRPGFRKDHIFLIDNASYHRSNELMKFFKDQKLQIMFSGSYSYDACPAELFFAAFKSADINPRHVP